mgnify:CR=1 FL=1
MQCSDVKEPNRQWEPSSTYLFWLSHRYILAQDNILRTVQYSVLAAKLQLQGCSCRGGQMKHWDWDSVGSAWWYREIVRRLLDCYPTLYGPTSFICCTHFVGIHPQLQTVGITGSWEDYKETVTYISILHPTDSIGRWRGHSYPWCGISHHWQQQLLPIARTTLQLIGIHMTLQASPLDRESK